MHKVKIFKNRFIGDGEPVFIIAEAGSNHDGNFEQAKKLIDIAAKAKADAVKFQLFRASKIYNPNCGKIPGKKGKKIDLYKFLEQTELPLKWLYPLKKYAESKGLVFIVTPFDEESADELEKISVVAYKIASPEISHLPLIKHISKKRKPLILSTGFSRLSEIEDALDAVYAKKNKNIAILHCVSSYPAPLEDFNLKVIENLKMFFQVPVGISDHSKDPIIIPRLAVLSGASVIEKHFTLDKNLPTILP
ncbi:MAG: N-acetylneuraminate synthase family protein [Candidatus Staskawiczbacteria bacterium]|nr:N-acetylneuraminate synthase family protein [Candidatus Staskawiczbacteria bacterium]